MQSKKLLLLCLVALFVLTGCPQKTQPPSRTEVNIGSSTSSAHGEQSKPSAPGARESQAPTGESPATANASSGLPPTNEADNPKPSGDNWVYVPQLYFYVGQDIPALVHLATHNAGKGWVGLIPESVNAADAAANEAGAVVRQFTTEAVEVKLNFVAPQAGRFRLRLYPSSDSAAVPVGETPVITIQQWPMGDRSLKTAPYITISPNGSAPITYTVGDVVTAHYEMPAGYPDGAWIGVVPTSITSTTDTDNDAANLGTMFLQGKTSGDFAWTSDRDGIFVFRVFPSSADGANFVAESEPFTVAVKPGV